MAVRVGFTLILLAAALAYLRDPPWLLRMTAGLGAVETDASGVGSRWMAGHASFFVPSDAQAVSFPIRTAFDAPADWPVTATVTLDDTPVERVVLTTGAWRVIRFRLPPAGTRNVRRVDVRVDRTRPGNRGAQIGEIRVDGR